MKRLLGTLIAATLVLSACSQNDTKEDENKSQKILLKRNLTIKKTKKTNEDKKSGEQKEISRKKE